MQLYVLLTIFSAFCSGVSLVLQKKGIEKISEHRAKLIKRRSINWKVLKNLIKKLLHKHFLVGSAIGLIGALAYIKAMSIGEISIIQPLLNVSTIVTWIFGIFYLKEKIYSKEWLSLFLIFFGAVILSVTI